eukprot:9593696-Ditylum_brightwellii.AAC.1
MSQKKNDPQKKGKESLRKAGHVKVKVIFDDMEESPASVLIAKMKGSRSVGRKDFQAVTSLPPTI